MWLSHLVTWFRWWFTIGIISDTGGFLFQSVLYPKSRHCPNTQYCTCAITRKRYRHNIRLRAACIVRRFLTCFISFLKFLRDTSSCETFSKLRFLSSDTVNSVIFRKTSATQPDMFSLTTAIHLTYRYLISPKM